MYLYTCETLRNVTFWTDDLSGIVALSFIILPSKLINCLFSLVVPIAHMPFRTTHVLVLGYFSVYSEKYLPLWAIFYCKSYLYQTHSAFLAHKQAPYICFHLHCHHMTIQCSLNDIAFYWILSEIVFSGRARREWSWFYLCKSGSRRQ